MSKQWTHVKIIDFMKNLTEKKGLEKDLATHQKKLALRLCVATPWSITAGVEVAGIFENLLSFFVVKFLFSLVTKIC